MDDFDPYYIWLGIPPEEQPPDHYRLLGLRRFEPSSDVIANAAEGKMAFLRTLQVGKRAKYSQKLLNEVAAAQACLLNEKQRPAYDTKLRQAEAAKLAAATPSPPPPVPTPQVAAVASPQLTPLTPLAVRPAVTLQPLAPRPVRSVGTVAPPPVPVDLSASLAPLTPNFSPQRFLPPTKPATSTDFFAQLDALPRPVLIAIASVPVIISLLILIVVIVVSRRAAAPPRDLGSRMASQVEVPLAIRPSPISPPPIPTPPPQPVSTAPPTPITTRSPRPDPPRPVTGPPRRTNPVMTQLRIDLGDARLEGVVFSPNGQYMAVDSWATGQRYVNVVEVQSGRRLSLVSGKELQGRMAMHDDAILVVSDVKSLGLLKPSARRMRPGRTRDVVRDVAFSSNGQTAFILTEKELLAYDAETLEQRTVLRHFDGPHSLERLMAAKSFLFAFGPDAFEAYTFDGRNLARIESPGQGPSLPLALVQQTFVRLFTSQGQTQGELRTLDGSVRPITPPEPLPALQSIVPAEQSEWYIAWHKSPQEVALLDMRQWRTSTFVSPTEYELSHIAFSHDGRWLGAREGNGPYQVVMLHSVIHVPGTFAWPAADRQRTGQPPAFANVSLRDARASHSVNFGH